MRYSIGVSGPEIILTKVDVNDDSEEIEICHSYTYEGPDYMVADKLLRSGDTITTAIMDSAVLAYCRPNYVVFPGWMTRTSHIRYRGDLPGNLLSILDYIEKETGAKIIVLSVGPDREQTIVMN
jgi:adenylosuccinate synthase